jgi:hypothetical protein
MSIVVDFPAPFGPRRATVSPRLIVMSTPRTAWTGPLGDLKVFVSPARTTPSAGMTFWVWTCVVM